MCGGESGGAGRAADRPWWWAVHVFAALAMIELVRWMTAK